MQHLLEVAINVATAWAAGSVIGLERSINGRAAGFRTHALVALAAAAAAVVSMMPSFLPGVAGGGLRLDPTRLAQGVMTGIGFLGAGVIFKEGLSVQGLTTAASVWACAATGFLFGLGMYAPGALVTAAVMVTLIAFRVVEEKAPWPIYSFAVFRFSADTCPSEPELHAMIGGMRVRMREMSYRLIDEGKTFEYAAELQAMHGEALAELAQRLRGLPGLREFELLRVSK
jgi:putative Mg2+ transporter-C (MgtC) family protein